MFLDLILPINLIEDLCNERQYNTLKMQQISLSCMSEINV